MGKDALARAKHTTDRLNAFLAEPAVRYDSDDPASHGLYAKISAWASDPEYGGLPRYSAQHFTGWLADAWGDFLDGADETVTAKDVLEGAVSGWCGGRTL